MDDVFPAQNPKECEIANSQKDKCEIKKEINPVLDEVPKVLQAETLPIVSKREPLTTKNAVKFLLEGTLKTKVCRYCLNISSELSELDQILQIADKDTLYSVTIKDMVASFHPFKVLDDPNFPNQICNRCINRTLTSYLFTQQCGKAERALRNCFDDMYDKLTKLDPLERTHKRGRQKLNPNYNTLHAEYEKVMEYADPIINIVHTSEPLTEQQPIQEFECLKCAEVLPNLESLLNHATIHPKSMWYNCRLCGRSFPKLHHLKKHFRKDHSEKSELITPENKTFECKTCGVERRNYYEFLLHMEKHKFKTTMKHLVEGKMDKLCSICLSKGKGMTELGKTMSLHGGCPELVGERSVFSIVVGVLPEKKNKYQELLMPTQATIIRNVRKKTGKRGTFIFTNPTILSDEEIEPYCQYLFFFSEPKMDKDTEFNKDTEVNERRVLDMNGIEGSINDKQTNLDSISAVMVKDETATKIDMDINEGLTKTNDTQINFIVTEAIEIGSINDAADSDQDRMLIATNDKENYLLNQEDFCNFTDNQNYIQTQRKDSARYTFSNPVFVKLYETNMVNESENLKNTRNLFFDESSIEHTANIEKDFIIENKDKNLDKVESKTKLSVIESKKSWVFINCSEQTKNTGNKNYFSISEENISNTETTTNTCDYCWVFKNVNKCDYCNKSNILQLYPNSGTSSEKLTIENINIDLTTNNKKEKKKNIGKDVRSSIKTWLCGICLTNNDICRETCDCCEAMPIRSPKKDDFKFKQKTDNKVELDNANAIKTDSDNLTDTGSLLNIAKSNKLTTPNVISFDSYNAVDNKAEMTPMETESPETENLISFTENNVQNHEDMDFEVLTSNDVQNMEVNSHQNILGNDSRITESINAPINDMFKANDFQFSIGSGPVEKGPRKYKRAVRNMSRAFHK